jgi:hypothetical protein
MRWEIKEAVKIDAHRYYAEILRDGVVVNRFYGRSFWEAEAGAALFVCQKLGLIIPTGNPNRL